MKVFVVQRRDTDALCAARFHSSGVDLTSPDAWTHDIREAVLFTDDTTATRQRDLAKAADIEARVMTLTPQPW